MKLAVACMDIVDIVRRNKSDIVFFCKITQCAIDRLFLGQPVILYLEKEVLLPKDFHVFTHEFICLLHILPQNRLRDLPRHTGRERNNSLVVFPQELLVHTRLIIISLDICEGY